LTRCVSTLPPKVQGAAIFAPLNPKEEVMVTRVLSVEEVDGLTRRPVFASADPELLSGVLGLLADRLVPTWHDSPPPSPISVVPDRGGRAKATPPPSTKPERDQL
jgi:hypothetical protein